MLHKDEMIERDDEYLQRKLDTVNKEFKLYHSDYLKINKDLKTTSKTLNDYHINLSDLNSQHQKAINQANQAKAQELNEEINNTLLLTMNEQAKETKETAQLQLKLESDDELQRLISYRETLKSELAECKLKLEKEEAEANEIKNSSSFINRVRWAYKQVKSKTISAADLTGSVGFITNIILHATEHFESISSGAKIFFGTVATPLAVSAMAAGTLHDTYKIMTDEKIKQRKTRYGANFFTFGLAMLAIIIAVGVLAAPGFSIPLIFVGVTALGYYKNNYILKQTKLDITSESDFIAQKRAELKIAINAELQNITDPAKSLSNDELYKNPRIQRLSSEIRDHVNRKEILEKTAEHLKDSIRVNKMFAFSLAFLLGGIAAAAFPPLAAAFAIIGAISIGCAIIQGYRTRHRHEQEMKDLKAIHSQQLHKDLERGEIVKARSECHLVNKTRQSQTADVYAGLAQSHGAAPISYLNQVLAADAKISPPDSKQPVEATPASPTSSSDIDLQPLLKRNGSRS